MTNSELNVTVIQGPAGQLEARLTQPMPDPTGKVASP